tara:strand:- start:46 stop:651 length:606 start_codon:yes stop_codon:yes gene_type:complete
MKERFYYSQKKSGTFRVSFFIEKKVYCPTIEEAHRIMSVLAQLDEEKNSFNDVKFPEFTVNRCDKILTVKSQFIKGFQLLGGDHTKKYHSHYVDIIQRDLVERENCFSVRDYSPRNFIVEFDTLDLYYVDLTDGVSSDFDHIERMNKFYEHFLKSGNWDERKLSRQYMKIHQLKLRIRDLKRRLDRKEKLLLRALRAKQRP